jgi:2-C-methyl-D-erythritol 4-phosphate cytidylyltransferase/2-C-methyl-D-erythritol 2,4-cyclodiphosphate synthase
MNVAIIPAAGSGSRLGGTVAKQFIEIAGAPILIHTLRRFEACADIDAIIVPLPPASLTDFREQLETHRLRKPVRLISGGSERSLSILSALEAITDWQPEIVAVHDAVRPFVTTAQISAVIARAREVGAAILALPATDTIKEVESGLIARTLERRRIYRAQTPQAFRYELLRRANEEARAAGLPAEAMTDDALLLERLGLPVAVVEGSAHNLKITTPEDLELAEKLLEQTSSDQSAIRIGSGYDIHRLVAGRKLILGGVEIAFELGLLGHSDGDSLSHAITDALFGAAGLGDIGKHFSDQDPRYAGIDSLVMLRRVSDLLAERGLRIENIDATIHAESPKMAPHIAEMRARLAEAMNIAQSQLNIKAKTNEGLDAVGRGEAIAAQAIALIRL